LTAAAGGQQYGRRDRNPMTPHAVLQYGATGGPLTEPESRRAPGRLGKRCVPPPCPCPPIGRFCWRIIRNHGPTAPDAGSRGGAGRGRLVRRRHREHQQGGGG